MARQVEDSIRRTLAPYLGIGNFQSSVSARLNTDRRQTSARTFDPDGRVERSVRTVRETGQSTDREAETPVTVDQNVPLAEAEGGQAGSQSSQANERREELTNFEINETTVQTVSEGYAVERLSVAVIVNRARLLETLGENTGPEAFDAALAEIRALVASASGLSEDRGDRIEVTAVDFAGTGEALEPVPGIGLMETLASQFGTLVNALTILVVAILVIWFGLKPAVKAIAKPAETSAEGLGADAGPDLLGAGGAPELPELAALPGFSAPSMEGFGADFGSDFGPADGGDPALMEELDQMRANSPQVRLERLVDFDEEQAAAILKQWIHEKKAA